LAFPRISTANRIWIVSAVIVVATVAWFAWPRAVIVETAAVDRGEVSRGVTEEGRVRVHDVYTVASPVGGVLNRIQLEAGDAVAKGDVVALISPADPALLDARVAEEAAAGVAAARAALALAGADLELARSDEARTRELFQRGFAAQAALDRAHAGFKVATSTVAQRKAELNHALASQGKPGARARTLTTVRSPTSGRVLRVLQESETVVPAGAPLLDIGDPARIDVVAEFLSQDAAIMREGAKAFVENWGGKDSIAAVVHTIEPYARTKISALGVEEQRANVIVELVDQPSGAAARLGHGFRVDVRVVVFSEKDALRAPTDALIRQSDGGWAAFRVVDGRARLTRVAIGDGDDRFRAVAEGLKPGDQLVLFPGDALREGDPVRTRASSR